MTPSGAHRSPHGWTRSNGTSVGVASCVECVRNAEEGDADTPGVYLVNGSPYGRHQNGYLIHAASATVLIDSGDLHDAETLPEVERNTARWGFRLEQASHLFVTHAHFDHASHAAVLQRRGLKVVCSPETAEALATGEERAVQWTFEPCQADIVVLDGEELTVDGLRVRCLAAPGHCNGLMIYEMTMEAERLWFTSDLLIAQHTHSWVELPWTGAPDFDRPTYNASLARLLKQPSCDHLFPGHGPAAIGGARRLLEMSYTEALLKWR